MEWFLDRQSTTCASKGLYEINFDVVKLFNVPEVCYCIIH